MSADSEVATICLIPTGSSSPAVKLNATAAGVDLSSPLVHQFPQVFTACPAATVPAGDHVAAADVAVQGLVGACVRITRRGTPVQTTLVVLDRNLIMELEAAGVPLQQLIVPCPASGTATTHPGAPAAGGAGGGTRAAASTSAVPSLSTRLAFTGAAIIPLGLAGIVLTGMGVLCSRRAGALNADIASAAAARG